MLLLKFDWLQSQLFKLSITQEQTGMTTLARHHLQPTLDFLLALQKHNNKPWFDAHRAEYEEAKQRFEEFVDNFIRRVSIH